MSRLHKEFQVLAKCGPAPTGDISTLHDRFGSIPQDYLETVAEVTELELQHVNGQYLRIWGPSGCIVMYDAYNFQTYWPSALPVGDDGGGRVIFYADGNNGYGLYAANFNDLELKSAVWVSPSLSDILTSADEIYALSEHGRPSLNDPFYKKIHSSPRIESNYRSEIRHAGIGKNLPLRQYP